MPTVTNDASTSSCLTNVAAPSPSPFDSLDRVNIGLRALAGLLHPSDDLRAVPREDLAMLLALLDAHEADMDSLVTHARTAVVDLIGAGHHLDCLTREHLHALIALLSGMQSSALESLRLPDQSEQATHSGQRAYP